MTALVIYWVMSWFLIGWFFAGLATYGDYLKGLKINREDYIVGIGFVGGTMGYFMIPIGLWFLAEGFVRRRKKKWIKPSPKTRNNYQ